MPGASRPDGPSQQVLYEHVPHQGPQDDDDGVMKWVAETEAEEDSEVTAQTKKLLGELYTAFVECDEDGNLVGAAYSDGGYPIMGMLLPAFMVYVALHAYLR